MAPHTVMYTNVMYVGILKLQALRTKQNLYEISLSFLPRWSSNAEMKRLHFFQNLAEDKLLKSHDFKNVTFTSLT